MDYDLSNIKSYTVLKYQNIREILFTFKKFKRIIYQFYCITCSNHPCINLLTHDSMHTLKEIILKHILYTMLGCYSFEKNK